MDGGSKTGRLGGHEEVREVPPAEAEGDDLLRLAGGAHGAGRLQRHRLGGLQDIEEIHQWGGLSSMAATSFEAGVECRTSSR